MPINSEAPGSKRLWLGPNSMPRDVRHDEADKGDGAAYCHAQVPTSSDTLIITRQFDAACTDTPMWWAFSSPMAKAFSSLASGNSTSALRSSAEP
jgi:hypothetical protein